MLFRRPEMQRGCGTGRAGYGSSYVVLLSGGIAGVALVVGLGSPSLAEHGQLLHDDLGLHASGTGVAQAVAATSEPNLQAFINRYCVVCHNQALATADLVLDTLDASNPSAHPETWEKVITKLRWGTMPPAGMPRADPDTYATISEWLERELDQARAAYPNPGRIPAVHRLNRTEYSNAIRDLLGLDVDVRSQLPGDETADASFDNIAAALTISTAHLDRYLSVGRQVTRLATGLPSVAPRVEHFPVENLLKQGKRMSENLPLGSRGGIAVRHHFPVDGEYIISVQLKTNYAEYVEGLGWEQELDFRLDGELLERFTVGGGGLKYRPTANSYTGGASGGGPGEFGSQEWEEYMQLGAQEGLEVRVRVDAGSRVVGVSFARDHWEQENLLLPQPPVREWAWGGDYNDYMDFAGVQELGIDGPYQVQGTAKDTPSRRKIFICEPHVEAEEESCAAQILSRMARRGYRRPVRDEDMETLLEFFHLGRQDGRSFDAGIQFALERILVDPEFLLRVYRDPPSQLEPKERGSEVVLAPQKELPGYADSYPLSDLEVASRLAFFLWSSIPDEPLLDLAEEGRLIDPPVLREHVMRMLADPRAQDALVQDFASQWLNLRLIEEQTAHERIYPDFDHNLRDASRLETELFIASTLREDRSILDLLRADYTYVNERLARHYNIPNVYGSHFRRVTLPDLEQRGGLLGHASLLSVTSYPDRTTPVLRGKWLLENILGTPVPPPPPNVDTSLPEEDEGNSGTRGATIRERLARHRDDPVCSTCHGVMDPLGFALESFDALGGWRTVDERSHPVDNVGTWPSGMEVKGFSGLRAMLLERGEQFVRNVTEKLMAYALGRKLEYYDRPAVRKIVRDAAADDYRWSSVILGIVESPQFLRRAHAAESVQ